MKLKFYNPVSTGPSARIQKMAVDARIRGQNQPPDTFPANLSTAFKKYAGLPLNERQAKSSAFAIENMPVYMLPDSDLVGMRYHLGAKAKIAHPMDWQEPATERARKELPEDQVLVDLAVYSGGSGPGHIAWRWDWILKKGRNWPSR